MGGVIWIGAIVLFGGFVGGIFYSLRTSEAYELGAAKLQASAEAANVLGTPISTGIPLGSISFSGASGRAILSFSVTGTKAAGRLFVDAVRRDGVWSITTLTLKVDGSDIVIDLMKEKRVWLEGVHWCMDARANRGASA
jgi:hypothetical protein